VSAAATSLALVRDLRSRRRRSEGKEGCSNIGGSLSAGHRGRRRQDSQLEKPAFDIVVGVGPGYELSPLGWGTCVHRYRGWEELEGHLMLFLFVIMVCGREGVQSFPRFSWSSISLLEFAAMQT